MVAHLLHLFIKWPRHIFFESLFYRPQNEIQHVDVTCYAKSEMTNKYKIFGRNLRTL